MPVRRAAALLAATLLAACGNGGSSGAVHDAAAACPGAATTCPSGCSPLVAFAYDADAGCVAPHLGVVGCAAKAPQGGDEGCVLRTTDGALFRAVPASSFEGVEDWQPCDADAGARLTSAPRCTR